MKRLSSPIRVMPPPLAVPRWTVQNSRKRLRSPISSRGLLAPELQVLRIEAEGGVREDAVVAADARRALDLRAGADLGAGADLDAGADHGERADRRRPSPSRGARRIDDRRSGWIDRAQSRGSCAASTMADESIRLGRQLAVDQRRACELADAWCASAATSTSKRSWSPGTTGPAELAALDRRRSRAASGRGRA